MEPATIELIEKIFTDAIKILGPAIIAAIVGYKVGKAQVEVRLKETHEKHRFAAREHLFKYYTDRQENLRKSMDSLNEYFGFILGFSASGSVDVQFDITTAKMVNMHLNMAPQEMN